MKGQHLVVFLACFYLLVCSVQAQPVTPVSGTNDVRVFNASRVNSEDMEFCPAVYENGLVYVSRYKNGPIDAKTGQTFFELFYSELDPNGMPSNRESFSTEINSAYHEGPVSFNRSGSRIFFTRSNTRNGVRRSDAKGRTGLKIYEAHRGLFDWENVEELSFNSDDYSCMHPALSPDEKKLFFSSSRPGGYGGMDLYFVEWINDRWSRPVNLGPEINTSKNEAFPFVHESNILFFSSDGHKGTGGLDLFMIDMSGRKWGQVYNLGTPFNSTEDDLGLVVLEDGKSGYFSSSRGGGFGEDDLYMFTTPSGLRAIKPATTLSGVVTATDRSTSRRLSGASIRLFELDEDGLIKDKDVYEMELVPSDSVDTEMVMTMVRKKDELLGSPLGVTDRNGESVVGLKRNTKYLILVSKTDYFTEELTFTTDEAGPNKPLELLLRPVDCIMLSGSSKSDRFEIPIPNVTLLLKSDCTDQLSTYRTNIRGEYEICLPVGCNYTIQALKPGYEDGNISVTTVRLRGSRSLSADVSIHPTSDAILREPIREGTVIVLENIYYDFNKSAIRKGAAQDLEALVQLMNNYPSMQIELGSHTDSRGTDEYNLDLSKRRAESAKEFLVQRGVASKRIRTVGYGEEYLRNKCGNGVECTEKEHLMNRRTEVTVLNIDERVKVQYEEDDSSN